MLFSSASLKFRMPPRQLHDRPSHNESQSETAASHQKQVVSRFDSETRQGLRRQTETLLAHFDPTACFLTPFYGRPGGNGISGQIRAPLQQQGHRGSPQRLRFCQAEPSRRPAAGNEKNVLIRLQTIFRKGFGKYSDSSPVVHLRPAKYMFAAFYQLRHRFFSAGIIICTEISLPFKGPVLSLITSQPG